MMSPSMQMILALITAHLIGDFVLQSRESSQNRANLWVLLRHALSVAAVSYVIAGAWSLWEIPVAILVTHTVIDSIKTRSGSDGIAAFVVDQTAHVAVIVVIAQWMGAYAPSSLFWFERFGRQGTTAFLLAAGLVATTAASGVLIQTVIRPFQERLSSDPDERGFPSGGRTIGHLERFLIFVFVLVDQIGAVGFLIAAKSILRFGEIRDGRHRKEAEYIIIGTMWSFACGLVASLVVKALLAEL